MRHYCAKCDEELVGAVNRCWKCGAPVDTTLLGDVPPIRRQPVPLPDATTRTQSPSLPEEVESPPPNSWVSAPERWRVPEWGRDGAAYGSVLFGFLACVLGFLGLWAVLVAAIAVALGVYGMGSPRRNVATMGLVFAVIAVFLWLGYVGSDLWARHRSQQWLQQRQDVP